MPLPELTDLIERTHHAYLKRALLPLAQMAARVATAHGDRDPRLHEVRDTVSGFADLMAQHMHKEERILFPMIRELATSETKPDFHCGSLAAPVRQMEFEHDDLDGAIRRLHTLTDGFAAPQWACETYRALLAGLAELERDTAAHVHKENEVLFPRALAEEQRKGA
jgi:regulator of cell morphogenesis and NO signaling